jgi:hypothetical protein
MNDLLLKLGLMDTLVMELNTSHERFIKAFKENVDPPQFELVELFSSSRKPYRGEITENTFLLKRRVTFSTSRIARGKANGKFFPEGDKLVIKAELTAVNTKSMLLVSLLLIFIYCIILFIAIVTQIQDDPPGIPFWVIPFILVHGAFIFGILYFAFKNAVRKLKDDLERDFILWLNDLIE